jgi:hypothetical protein
MVTRDEITDVLIQYGHVPTAEVPKHLRIVHSDVPLDDAGFALAFALGLYRYHLRYGLDLNARMQFDGDGLVGWRVAGDPTEIFAAMESEYLDPWELESEQESEQESDQESESVQNVNELTSDTSESPLLAGQLTDDELRRNETQIRSEELWQDREW